MTRHLEILFIVIFVWTSCQQSQTENDVSAPMNVVATENKSLDGYWVLCEFADSVLRDKSISRHRSYPLAYWAAIIEIKHDTLYSNGLLEVRKKLKIYPEQDTFCKFNDWGQFRFTYDSTNKQIVTRNIVASGINKFPDKIFRYRRLTDERLLSAFSSKKENQISEVFNNLFVDSLIAGKYESVKNRRILRFENSGNMSGFRNYNRFKIHDYFGTHHPFDNYDVILFEDTTFDWSANGPPPTARLSYYNWTFLHDTLHLTEMVTKDHEQFSLGTKTYKYKRTTKYGP